MKVLRCILLLALLLNARVMFSTSVVNQKDSIRISLLTCAPGDEVYSLFGHTAIRYQDPQQKLDIVFNYGMFSFKTPHFLWRFIKGETDYELGVNSYQDFASEYIYLERGVNEQILNLTSDEKTSYSNYCRKITGLKTEYTATITSLTTVQHDQEIS